MNIDKAKQTRKDMMGTIGGFNLGVTNETKANNKRKVSIKGRARAGARVGGNESWNTSGNIGEQVTNAKPV